MLLIISLLAFGAERNRRCSEMPPPPINYNLDTTTKDMVRLSQYAVYGTIVEEVTECPEGQVFKLCPSTCQTKCGVEKPMFCNMMCGKPACVCPNDEWLHSNGISCIKDDRDEKPKKDIGPDECNDKKPTQKPTTRDPWGGTSGPAEMVLDVEAYYCGCGPERVIIKGCRFCEMGNSCDPQAPQPGQKWLAFGCDIGSEEDDDDETQIPPNAITLAKFNRHGDFESFGTSDPYRQVTRWNSIDKYEEDIQQGAKDVGCKRMTPAQCKTEKMDNQDRVCRNKRSGAEALAHVKDKMQTEITSKTSKVEKDGWDNRVLAANWEVHYDEFKVMFAAFEADRDGDNAYGAEEFAALWSKQDQLRRDLNKLKTALTDATNSYTTAAGTTRAYLNDPANTRGGAEAMAKLILLLNSAWLCPPWNPGPCSITENQIGAVEQSYEVKYLTKVVADIAKIEPQPFNMITTVTTATTSTATETYTFTSTTTASTTTKTTATTTTTKTTTTTTATKTTTTASTTTETTTTTTTESTTTDSTTTVSETSTSVTVTTSTSTITINEQRIYDALKSTYQSQALELKFCLRENKDDAAACEKAEMAVAQAMTAANAQALIVGEVPITPKPAEEDDDNGGGDASTAKKGADTTTSIVIAVVIVLIIAAVAVVVVKKNSGGAPSNAMSHVNPVYESGSSQQHRNAGMSALPQFPDSAASAPQQPAYTENGNSAGYADVDNGFNAGGYADVGVDYNTGGYDANSSDEEEC